MNEKKERTILRFALDMSHDATSYVNYVYAPSDWDTRTPEAREEFMKREAEYFLADNVSSSVTVYSGEEPSWETGGHPSEPEDHYDD